ncbi:MAG: DUF4421 family protein [Cytophagales bacterium]
MNSNSIVLVFVFLLINLENSYSIIVQEEDTASNIVTYHDDLNLKFILNTKYNNFIIDNENLPGRIHWKTNDNNNIGIGGNYKWFGLNLLFNIPALNNDDEIYGNTTSFNLIGNIYTKKIGLDLFLQSTRGFYLESPETWNPGWTPEELYPHNSGLNFESLGANFLYVYDADKYSLRSNFILNERQLESAGSAILGSYFNIFSLSTDTSFIPFAPDTATEFALDIREASYVNLGAFIGYSHTFIFEDYFFISLTGALGIAIQGSNIITANDLYNNEDQQNINGKFHLRAAVGYSNDIFFSSLSLIADNNRLGQSLNYNFGYARLTFGYRIKLKKKA